MESYEKLKEQKDTILEREKNKPVCINLRDVMSALFASAKNTDTDPRWLAADYLIKLFKEWGGDIPLWIVKAVPPTISELEKQLENPPPKEPDLKSQLEACKEGLRFYANYKNWKNESIDIGVGEQEMPGNNEACYDGGDIARAIIADMCKP